MSLISIIDNKKRAFLSILIALMPFSFMAGNMILSLNTIFLILMPILFFRKDVFRINFFILDKILITFFILILITGAINNFHLYPIYKTWGTSIEISLDEYFLTIIKSILFLKYLLLYIVIRFLIEKDIINLKFFLFVVLLHLYLYVLIFFQFFYGKIFLDTLPLGENYLVHLVMS